MVKKGNKCKYGKKIPQYKPLLVEELEKVVNLEGEGGNDELEALLLPHRSKLPKKLEKPRRSVQWNDEVANKLAEVLEFQPGDISESDDEDSNSCFCVIM